MDRQSAAVLDGVSKTYPGGVVAVDDVSLEVRQGEFFSLLGPSGCGKTTTLRMLAGLEVPTAGRIVINGSDVTGVAPNRRPTNLIFQKLALFPHLSIADNIAFGPRIRGLSRRQVATKVSEMLALVELEGFERRLPAEISGGQQQRVAIARALANEPAVLLLDEPLGALDLKLRTQMQQALKDIQRDSGTTFIFVTHDQVEAMTMSDRMAVMHDGRADQVGSPLELYNRPTTVFCATFLGDTNLFRGESNNGTLSADGMSLPIGRGNQLASIRPERISISRQPVADSVSARITRLTFQGATVRAVARTEYGREILIDLPASGTNGLAHDDPVHLHWPADAVVGLPA